MRREKDHYNLFMTFFRHKIYTSATDKCKRIAKQWFLFYMTKPWLPEITFAYQWLKNDDLHANLLVELNGKTDLVDFKPV